MIENTLRDTSKWQQEIKILIEDGKFLEALSLAEQRHKDFEGLLKVSLKAKSKEITRLKKTETILRKTIKGRMSFEDEQEKYIARLKANREHYKNQVKTICYDQEQELTRLEKELKSARAENEQFDYDKMVARALTDANNARKEERQKVRTKLEEWLETAYCMEGNKRMFKEHFAELLGKVKE